MAGQKTLLVDLDPQGHVAFALGVDKAPRVISTGCRRRTLSNVIVTTRENLDIVPGDKKTEKAKRAVVISIFPRRSSAAFQERWIRCGHLRHGPSLDVLHVSALMASDWVLIPTKLDAMAIDGVNRSPAFDGGSGGARPPSGIQHPPTFFDRNHTGNDRAT